MRKFALIVAVGSVASFALGAQISAGHAADLGAGKPRYAKTYRAKVVRDPCQRLWSRSAQLDPYSRGSLVYVHGNSYQPGVCIDGDTGPNYRPFWAWGM